MTRKKKGNCVRAKININEIATPASGLIIHHIAAQKDRKIPLLSANFKEIFQS